MSNQSRGRTFPFSQQPHSLSDARTKTGNKKRRLSFNLPPKDYRVVDNSSGSGSSSVDNNVQEYYGHGTTTSWNNGYKVRPLII